MLDDVLGITADLGRTAGPEPEKRRKRKFGRRLLTAIIRPGVHVWHGDER